METQKNRTNQRKMRAKQGFGKRSPLQHLNGHQFQESSSKKSSILSSSCFAASLPSSSSSSRTHLDRKPKTLPNVANYVTLKSSTVTLSAMPRSMENEVRKKHFPEKSKKTQQPCLGRRYGKATRNPVKLLKKMSEELEISHRKGLGEQPIKRFELSANSNLDFTERCTPARKTGNVSFSELMTFGDCKNAREISVSKTGNGDSATSVKTPPVEASVSPEIQCGSHSTMMALKSAATPVCYGAGHLLSGVTDKRKCRRRGSLRGGCEKGNLFDDDENAISESLDPSIPLLAEASVRWLLSPQEEGCEGDDSENRIDKCEISHGNSSVSNFLSSPSTSCGDVSDFRCDDSLGDPANHRKDGILLLSPRKEFDIQCTAGHSYKKMNESLLAATPNFTSNCNGASPVDGKNEGSRVIEKGSASSLGSMSSGNIIETPSSDSSSYEWVGMSNVGALERNSMQFELDSITETINAVSMSPRTEMSIRDVPSLGFQSADIDLSSDSIIPIPLQKNVASVCSWVSSNSTLENLALSHTRISWRDELVCEVDENEESDCCRCLSDEEIDAVGCSYGGHDRRFMSGENEDNAVKVDNDALPILLEYEPCISGREKEKLSKERTNACAESICTIGGDLAASCDSDWTYLSEDHLFQLK